MDKLLGNKGAVRVKRTAISPELREWRKALADWRKGLKLRVMIGAYDNMFTHYQQFYRANRIGPSPLAPYADDPQEADSLQAGLFYGSEYWVNLLSSSMKERKYPDLLVIGLLHYKFFLSPRRMRATPLTSEQLYNLTRSGFDRYVSDYRWQLKKSFGVHNADTQERSRDTPKFRIDPP